MPRRIRPVTVLAVLALAVLTFAARFAYGMRVPLDADEATCALVAQRITQGHGFLMEANFHYLGALNSYIMAPFVAVLGNTLPAVRLATATVGTAYTLVMYAIGRRLLGGHPRALVLALVASFFPVFVFAWNMKARTYAETLLLTSVCLWPALRIAWPDEMAPRRRDWALLGFAGGIGLWNDILIVAPLGIIALALLMRASAIGTRDLVRGALVAALAAALGFAPWIAYNVINPLRSLHGLPDTHVGILHGISGFLQVELPIYIGAWGTRHDQVVGAVLSDVMTALGIAAVVWVRREALVSLIRGLRERRFSNLDAAEVMLVILPVMVLLAVLGPANGTIDEPRYLVPGAISAAVGLTLLLLRPWPWRAIAIAATATLAVVSLRVALGPMADTQRLTSTGVRIPDDLSPVVAALEQGPKRPVVIADYWLARPLMYDSAGRLAVAEYGGGAAFPDVQDAAETSADTSWLFLSADPTAHTLATYAITHHVSVTTRRMGDFILYSDFSRPVRIADLHLPVVR